MIATDLKVIWEMSDNMKHVIQGVLNKLGYKISRFDPTQSAGSFHSDHYLRHNARRLEHLASLGISVEGRTVLEVGAGIGDHSHFYLDRNCQVTITESREENLRYLRRRYPDQDVRCLDLERPTAIEPFEIVHCYGLLYHLSDPASALVFLNEHCKMILFLETRVSFGGAYEINPVGENRAKRTEAASGIGCRPTRPWLFAELRKLFEHVYVPITQPNHPEFPLNWDAPEEQQVPLSRSVFIASREEIESDLLSASLVAHQARHP